MPVVSHQVIADPTLQSDGRRYVEFLFTFHNGYVHKTSKKKLDAIADYNAMAVAAYPVMEESRAKHEDNTAIQRVENGEDALTIVLNPVFSTSKRIVKKLIRWMMREKDPRIALLLEPLVDYLRANYNASQLSDFLDVDTSTLLRVNARYDDIITNKIFLQEDELKAEEIE